jgi:hypothetical protein
MEWAIVVVSRPPRVKGLSMADYADEEEVGAFAADLPDTFLLCREIGHNWRPFFARWDVDENAYQRTLRCQRCKTQRHQWMSYSGSMLGNQYEYTEGYQHKGLGRIVGEGRDRIRLESITRLVEKLGRSDGASD